MPMAVDDFVLQTEARVDVGILAVAVRRLVQVHVVEVDRVVRDAVEVLRREVEEWFLQQHFAADPVLRRRERVHPRDDARDVVAVVHVLHELRDALGRRHDALELDGVREMAARIELVDNILRIARHVLQLLFAIEELAARDEPEFIFWGV